MMEERRQEERTFGGDWSAGAEAAMRGRQGGRGSQAPVQMLWVAPRWGGLGPSLASPEDSDFQTMHGECF